MKYVRSLALLASVAAISTPLLAQAAKQDDKTVHFIESEAPLQLKVSASRPEYKTEEPITLKVELDRPAYFYVYSRGNDGRSQFVYPAPDARETKLPAGKQTVRSGAADKPGEEELVAFATDKPLDLGDEDAFRAPMLTRDFEQRLSGLGLRVGPNAREAQLADVSLPQSVTFKVAGDAGATESSVGVALVATDKSRYKVGDPLVLAFGTSKAGYVQLFMAYKNGRIDPLISHKFTAPGVISKAAVADVPAGEQTILAVYSTDGKVSPRMLNSEGYIESSPGKAIRLRDPETTGSLAVTSRVITVGE
jgi:hypothetical protein